MDQADPAKADLKDDPMALAVNADRAVLDRAVLDRADLAGNPTAPRDLLATSRRRVGINCLISRNALASVLTRWQPVLTHSG